ncbi:MAG TPA: serine protease [Pseudonocardia sp.]
MVGAATAGALAIPGAASASGRFASEQDASIHPGVTLDSAAGQCTSNFLFTSGDKTYIGMAAHCVGKGGETDTDGCKSRSYPLGTRIKIHGARNLGRLAYSSWITMQKHGERNDDLCAYNDFALVELDDDDVRNANPTVPHFGGPVGLRRGGLEAGAQVYTYGNSDLRAGLSPLSPKQGVNLGDEGRGRTHQVVTLSPGVPGDSGSGFLDSDGRAFGVLSTLSLTPLPGSNGVSDLAKAVDYANNEGNMDIQLVEGDRDFSGGTGLPVLGTGTSGPGLGNILGDSATGSRRGVSSSRHGLLPGTGI